jgi:ABC-type Fe3+-hydroxamate transport system substrate-binding protein
MEITEAPEDRASRYRCTAAHLRQQANALDKTQERAELLAIADQYERLADRIGDVRADKIETM